MPLGGQHDLKNELFALRRLLVLLDRHVRPRLDKLTGSVLKFRP